MDLQANKTDGKALPSSNRRISADEWNQLVASCMAFIYAAGLTPDAQDNEQFLNAFKAIAANLELVGANTNLSNLTAAGEARFATKANADLSNVNKPHVTDAYTDGASWYRVWSDGWCEQGGKISLAYRTNEYVDFPITLLKPMRDTNYTVLLTASDRNSVHLSQWSYSTLNVENFTTRTYSSGGAVSGTGFWRVSGYIA